MMIKLITACLTLACLVLVAVTAAAEPVVWDTVATSTAWGTGTPTGSGDNIALSVANNGEMGQLGIGGVNLDFTVDGGDTGIRPADSVYLRSGSLFLMRHDGDSVLLTTSIAQKDWTSPDWYDSISYDFVPVPEGGPMSSGVYNDGDEDVYDSVFIGRLASRDSAVLIERTFYAPRSMGLVDYPFLMVRTKVFTGSKGAQSNLTIGDGMDWDVPSDRPGLNISHSSIVANAVYMQGTSDPDSSFAWDNTQRLAAETMMGWVTHSQLFDGECAEAAEGHGALGTFQSMMNDSLVAPGVREPNSQMWWDSIAEYDYNEFNPAAADQAIWVTYRHDFDLAESDTLYFFTALATANQGFVHLDLENTMWVAGSWYFRWMRGCTRGCCIPPTVGDVDQSGIVDITDISVFVDNLFLTLTPLVCFEEGDINGDGVTDISDLQWLIADQFICLGCPPPPCPISSVW
ncbi:MAG: hypothetical protein GY867_09910 [bacterium]|nr:hypothetical protein [bacterium]